MANKWLDQSQPQTLVSANVLLYINAVLWLITARFLVFDGLGLILVVAPVIGGVGIANERKWGYWVAVASTILAVLFFIRFFGFGGIITLIFYLALLVLLLHPMSRSYYKTWFH